MRAKLPVEHGHVVRDGVRIHYEIYGDGVYGDGVYGDGVYGDGVYSDGPGTMLFLPPWSIVHARVYKAQLPYFSERFRCIAFDGRGNGGSDRPADAAAYTLDNYVADALAVMDACDAGRTIAVGLSSGGMLACVLAAHHPDRVAAAVLVGTSATIGANYPYLTRRHFLTRQDRFDGWNKYNREYWLTNYPDFVDYFVSQIFTEPHSTRQIEDAVGWANETTGEVLVRTVEAWSIPSALDVSEAMYRKIACPVLMIHGDNDQIQRHDRAKTVAGLIGAEFVTIPGGGHDPLTRFPGKCNTLIDDFLDRRAGLAAPGRRAMRSAAPRRALYVSSPIGLGHARRDLAIARELRALKPDLQIDWLAQDPVTRLLMAEDERIHPLSARLASESRHIESEAGEHELHAFQAIRRMDEVLALNFMIFQNAVEAGGYDLVIGDEAWEVDHYWHEHPELKKAALAWFTDFVGYVPMPEGGPHEAFLSADYNAEMIEHVERNPGVRDRAIFVGEPTDIAPLSFGEGLPGMRDWVPRHFDFAGYIIGRHPDTFGPREQLREAFGYRPEERVCIVTVGGSGVGAHLIRRIVQSWPLARARVPGLRMIVVAGPRIAVQSFGVPPGVEVHGFLPDLDRRLAACDIALVQGGLTTCMELAAAGTPFIYFPLRNHFEQNFHVAHRLDRYGRGRRLAYAAATPETIAGTIAEVLRTPPVVADVEAGGAARAAAMLAELF